MSFQLYRMSPKNLENEPNSKFSTIFCLVFLRFSMEGSFISVLIIISFGCPSKFRSSGLQAKSLLLLSESLERKR